MEESQSSAVTSADAVDTKEVDSQLLAQVLGICFDAKDVVVLEDPETLLLLVDSVVNLPVRRFEIVPYLLNVGRRAHEKQRANTKHLELVE